MAERADSAIVIEADCVEAMRELDPESIDAVVCDPPYGLEFMGKEWDRLGAVALHDPSEIGGFQDGAGGNAYSRSRIRFGNHARTMQEWHQAWAAEALRVLKPGGHLLAFGGTRTYHRLACAVEDAGFEIRDTICWLYGSGFPKSLDVSKAIDKQAGAEREIGPERMCSCDAYPNRSHPVSLCSGRPVSRPGQVPDGYGESHVSVPATPEAERWQGWGTALKPAHEPVVVARKPLSGTVAGNVSEHGTGALNVDGCRVGTEVETWPKSRSFASGISPGYTDGIKKGETQATGNAPAGRWPANVALDPESAAQLDAQSGELKSGEPGHHRLGENTGAAYGTESRQPGDPMVGFGDTGGASRFFYCAKASRAERNAGLDGLPAVKSADDGYGSIQEPKLDRAAPRENWEPHKTANHHPTVKPVALMRWLVRLVTPPGGMVLDPFCGSGTTGIACVLEDFNFTGIEREPEYAAIARARIAHAQEHGEDYLTPAAEPLEPIAGQIDLFGEAA